MNFQSLRIHLNNIRHLQSELNELSLRAIYQNKFSEGSAYNRSLSECEKMRNSLMLRLKKITSWSPR
jgi:hypothetical protein